MTNKTDHIAELYEAQKKLSEAKTKGIKENKLYLFLIDSVNGDDQVKQLAAQFIPRFFDQYQELQEQAVNAQLDLCEDEELRIRIYAIRGLAELCKRSPDFVARIADVLGQLLLAEDAIELQTVKRTFLALFDLDTWSTFGALFQQIKEGDEELRQKGIEYMRSQILNLWDKIDKKDDLKKYLVEGIKDCLEQQDEMTTIEFKMCLDVLRRLLESYNGKDLDNEIGTLVIEKAELNSKFDAQNLEQISRFLSCFLLTNSLSNHSLNGTPFMNYFIENICHVFDQIPEKKCLPLLNAVLNCSKNVSASTASDLVESIYCLVEKYMPKKKNISSKFVISIVNCILLIFQELTARYVNITDHILSKALSDQDLKNKPDKREDFKERLRFFQASVKDYMFKLRGIAQTTRSIINKTSDKERLTSLNEKRKDVQMELKTASDLQSIINSLFQRRKTTAVLADKQKQLTPKSMIRDHLEKTGPVGMKKRKRNNLTSHTRSLKSSQISKKFQQIPRKSKQKPSQPRGMQTFYAPPKKNKKFDVGAKSSNNNVDRFRARTVMRTFKGRGPCKYRPGRLGGRTWIFSN